MREEHAELIGVAVLQTRQIPAIKHKSRLRFIRKDGVERMVLFLQTREPNHIVAVLVVAGEHSIDGNDAAQRRAHGLHLMQMELFVRAVMGALVLMIRGGFLHIQICCVDDTSDESVRIQRLDELRRLFLSDLVGAPRFAPDEFGHVMRDQNINRSVDVVCDGSGGTASKEYLGESVRQVVPPDDERQKEVLYGQSWIAFWNGLVGTFFDSNDLLFGETAAELALFVAGDPVETHEPIGLGYGWRVHWLVRADQIYQM